MDACSAARAHMVCLISAITRSATAQMLAKLTRNIIPRRRANLSNWPSVTALATASSATAASITTTDTVERKGPLVMGGTIPEATLARVRGETV